MTWAAVTPEHSNAPRILVVQVEPDVPLSDMQPDKIYD
jgi:hypothetical protein